MRRFPRASLQSLAIIAIGMLIGLTGCEDDAIRTYRVPKGRDAAPPPRTPAPQPATRDPEPPGGDDATGMRSGDDRIPPRDVRPDALPIEWQVPDNWRRVDNPNRFRVATFHAGDSAEDEPVKVAVSSLRGEGGGLLPNLNRWRRQIGLAPVNSPESVESAVAFEGERMRGMMFDMTGAAPADGPPRGMIVAVVRTPDRTWYVKMSGAAARIAPHRDEMFAFAKSFRWRAKRAETPGDRQTGPDTDNAAVPPTAPADPRWTMPDGWHEAVRTPRMLHALFHAPASGAAEPARISVVPLPGPAGGELANINRWRRQLGLPPVASMDQVETELIKWADGQAELVDLTQPPEQADRQRTLAAWLKRDGVTWFFKMTGPAAAVEAHIGAFRSFVGSVQFEAEP